MSQCSTRHNTAVKEIVQLSELLYVYKQDKRRVNAECFRYSVEYEV